MPNSKDEKGLRGPDKQQRALRDVREGAYDRGRVSRTRGQQSGQSGAEVPESAPPAETVPGTASKLPEGRSVRCEVPITEIMDGTAAASPCQTTIVIATTRNGLSSSRFESPAQRGECWRTCTCRVAA